MEAGIARHEQMLTTAARHPFSSTGLQGPLPEPGPFPPEDHADSGDLDPGTGISLRGADLEDLPREEELTDGMAISFMKEEDSGFFGEFNNLYSPIC